MNEWAKSKDEAAQRERQRLAKRIVPVKKMLVDSMKPIHSSPIDLSKFIKEAKKRFKSVTIEQGIRILLGCNVVQGIKEIEDRISTQGFSFRDLIATTKIDRDGRIKCIVPAVADAKGDDHIAVLYHEAEEYSSLVADMQLLRLLMIMKKCFSIDEASLDFLVNENAFVPEDRKTSFLKGLVAGFNLDFITAMSILMPQIENAIRCLAENCGAVVYKTKENGIEECLGLNSVLNLPELKECLDENFIFHLNAFFNSEYGFNMRNDVCHGLLTDAELQSSRSIAVWWFVLYLCCLFSPEFHLRIEQQNKSQKT